MRKTARNSKQKNKQKTKVRKKLTAKDFLRIFAIVLICAILVFGIVLRYIHFYNTHYK